MTPDQRAAVQWQHFRIALSDAGLSPAGGDDDERVMHALEHGRRIVAELRSRQAHALDQAVALNQANISAESLTARVRAYPPKIEKQ